jgi:hypothetical protein
MSQAVSKENKWATEFVASFDAEHAPADEDEDLEEESLEEDLEEEEHVEIPGVDVEIASVGGAAAVLKKPAAAIEIASHSDRVGFDREHMAAWRRPIGAKGKTEYTKEFANEEGDENEPIVAKFASGVQRAIPSMTVNDLSLIKSASAQTCIKSKAEKFYSSDVDGGGKVWVSFRTDRTLLVSLFHLKEDRPTPVQICQICTNRAPTAQAAIDLMVKVAEDLVSKKCVWESKSIYRYRDALMKELGFTDPSRKVCKKPAAAIKKPCAGNSAAPTTPIAKASASSSGKQPPQKKQKHEDAIDEAIHPSANTQD